MSNATLTQVPLGQAPKASVDVKRLDMLDGTPVLDIKPHVEIPSG
jgi:tRNA (Thr-GGU) A37 N-methylase